MQAQQHRRHRSRRRTQQLCLFKEDGDARRQGPNWDLLPTQTRQVLTDLMARLILDHKDKERALLPREPHHDV